MLDFLLIHRLPCVVRNEFINILMILSFQCSNNRVFELRMLYRRFITAHTQQICVLELNGYVVFVFENRLYIQSIGRAAAFPGTYKGRVQLRAAGLVMV